MNHAARIEAVRHHIRRHLDRTAAECCGQLDERRFDTISALLARALWWMRTAHLEVLADFGAVIFAFDDLVDDGDISVREAALRGEQFAAIAAGEECPELHFDPVGRLMTSITERLAGSALGLALWPTWSRVAGEMFRAMAAERGMAERLHAGNPPSFTETLRVGRQSVSIECVAVAAWMLMGEAATLDALSPLLAAASRYAVAVRCANDLRSADRERVQRSMNLLFLPGVDASVLRALLRHNLDEGRRLVVTLPPASATFVDAFARAFIDLYAEREVHDDITVTAA